MTRAELTERLARALCRHCGGSVEEWEDYLDDIEPILAELDALGLAIVPREASEAEIEVGAEALTAKAFGLLAPRREIIEDVHRAMLAAEEVK